MANMSSISCATTCGRRLPVSARKGSRAAPSTTRDGASYPQYAFQAAAISGFTNRITQQLIGRATERAAAVGALMYALESLGSSSVSVATSGPPPHSGHLPARPAGPTCADYAIERSALTSQIFDLESTRAGADGT